MQHNQAYLSSIHNCYPIYLGLQQSG